MLLSAMLARFANAVAFVGAPSESPDKITDEITDGSDAASERTSPYVLPDPSPTAPRPGHAHGLAREPKSWQARAAKIPRALLYVPRRTLELAVTPIRLLLVAYDRHALRFRVERIFFSRDRAFGLWPVLFVETGFGANGGLRVSHSDLLGHGEGLMLRAGWGGLYRRIYRARLDSGARFGRFTVGLWGRHDIQPRARFFGIGNGPSLEEYDSVPSFEPRLDPIRGARAVESWYTLDRTAVGLRLSYRLNPRWGLEAAQALTWTRFGPPDGGERSEPQLARIYDARRLTGYRRGLLNLYHELALTHEGTERGPRYLPAAMPARGWRARGYAGFAEGFDFDPSRFARVGLEVQRFFDLYAGNRVLSLRGRGDWVIGALERIPFTELAALGGPNYLRGYVRGRFRDRLATLFSVEYDFPISENFSGFLFTDVGRVWSGPRELAREGFRNTRFGAGGGLKLFARGAFFGRLQLAGAPDGGFFAQLRLQPSFSIRNRL